MFFYKIRLVICTSVSRNDYKIIKLAERSNTLCLPLHTVISLIYALKKFLITSKVNQKL